MTKIREILFDAELKRVCGGGTDRQEGSSSGTGTGRGTAAVAAAAAAPRSGWSTWGEVPAFPSAPGSGRRWGTDSAAGEPAGKWPPRSARSCSWKTSVKPGTALA